MYRYYASMQLIIVVCLDTCKYAINKCSMSRYYASMQLINVVCLDTIQVYAIDKCSMSRYYARIYAINKCNVCLYTSMYICKYVSIV